MRLTQIDVDKATYSGKNPDIRRDDAVPGLALRIYPSGRKSYIIEWNKDNRRGREVIGDARITHLSKIRDIARQKITAIKAGNVSLKVVTVADLAEEFINRHLKAKRRSWRQVERVINKWIKPELGSYRVDRLPRRVVSELHSRIGKAAPINANRTISYLRKMLNMAVEWGYLESSYDNPATRITMFPETKRSRYVTTGEMPDFIDAVNGMDDLFSRSVIWLLLLTACRENEILSLRWDQIDIGASLIHLTRTKQKKHHAVPIIPLAMDVIKGLHPVDDSPFVFPSSISKSGHIEGVRTSWNILRDSLKVRYGERRLTIHDLRRTLASWMTNQGTSTRIVGGVLGQSTAYATDIYARLSDDTRSSSMSKAVNAMVEEKEPFLEDSAT
jgi:integrase